MTRFEQSLKDIPFPRQREILFEVGEVLGQHWKKWRIDETGMGKNIAEDLVKKFGSRVEPVTFTNAVKEELANNLRILLEEGNIVLPRCRMIRAQIHSIKQRYTPAGNTIFDAERNRHHHADKMWAIALAVNEGKRKAVKVPLEMHVRSVGATDPNPPPAKGEEAPDPAKIGIVEALFTLPGEGKGGIVAGNEPFPTREEVLDKEREELRAMSDVDLQALGEALSTVKNVYRREGRETEAKAAHAKYARLRKEVIRRQIHREVVT